MGSYSQKAYELRNVFLALVTAVGISMANPTKSNADSFTFKYPTKGGRDFVNLVVQDVDFKNYDADLMEKVTKPCDGFVGNGNGEIDTQNENTCFELGVNAYDKKYDKEQKVESEQTKDRINELDNSISQTKDRINELDNSISQTQDRINELDNSISQTKYRIKQLNKDTDDKKYIVSKLKKI